MARCFYCGGSGRVECDCTGGMGRSGSDDDCYGCGGSGSHMCPACGGRGEIDDD